jgi:hypothetical protein
VKSGRAVVTLSILAHLLAWGALLFLVFWPAFYQGVQATPVFPNGPPPEQQEVVRVSASLIEGTGWWVLRLLLVPVALTAVALAVALRANPRSLASKLVVGACAGLLLGFCVMGAFSIGLFYLPAALALAAAAVVMAITSAPNRPVEAG